MERREDPQHQENMGQETERPARRERAQQESSLEKTKRVIDELENVLNSGRRIPLKNDYAVVNAAVLIDLLSQLRIVLPQAVRDGQEIMESSQKIIEDARRQADEYNDRVSSNCRTALDEANATASRVREEADEYSKAVHDQAAANASAMIADAQERARQIVAGAQQQAQQMLEENEITRRAQAFAMETRDRAQQDAASIYNQACVQVDKMLSGAAGALSRSAGEMAQLRDSLIAGQGGSTPNR